MKIAVGALVCALAPCIAVGQGVPEQNARKNLYLAYTQCGMEGLAKADTPASIVDQELTKRSMKLALSRCHAQRLALIGQAALEMPFTQPYANEFIRMSDDEIAASAARTISNMNR